MAQSHEMYKAMYTKTELLYRFDLRFRPFERDALRSRKFIREEVHRLSWRVTGVRPGPMGRWNSLATAIFWGSEVAGRGFSYVRAWILAAYSVCKARLGLERKSRFNPLFYDFPTVTLDKFGPPALRVKADDTRNRRGVMSATPSPTSTANSVFALTLFALLAYRGRRDTVWLWIV